MRARALKHRVFVLRVRQQNSRAQSCGKPQQVELKRDLQRTTIVWSGL